MTYAGADSEFGIACESATPSEAKQTTPASVKTASASQSPGQLTPNTTCPAQITDRELEHHVGDRAFAPTPAR